MAVCYSSYSYSETTYGVTNNAAGQALSWEMYGILPDHSAPWVTLQINGLTYRYTMNKDPETDAQVHVRNEDALGEGYVFSETDNWNQLPGGTIQKYFRFGYSDAARWGKGEIAVEGEGTVSDATVTYNYKLDVDETLMLCYSNPLSSPTCPGFRDALMKYLEGLTDPSTDDPFYNEWVQAQLNREVDLKEEDKKQKDEKKEESLEKRMGGKNTVDAMVDTKQQEALLAALADVQKIESYYTVEIQGGTYEETVKLEDTEIPDNKRALSNLASDAKHRTMVRSQYDKEQ